jgi:hypothetical protein
MDQKKKLIGCGFTSLIWGGVVIVGLVLGFFFLLRGCLSKWDSYGVMGWPGITEDQKSMVFVKSYSKTTSYSNQGGFVRKSYSTTYYLEKVELATGKVTKKVKLMSQGKIKKGGLNCYGGYKDRLWIFANFLRAYDMNTLEQVVKVEDIENKNPQLKGKMPVESQYYDEHINLGYITITALDGDKYNIMLDDLRAELVNDQAFNREEFNQSIKTEQEEVKAKMDSLYADYRNNKFSYDKFNEKQDRLSNIIDSLGEIAKNAEDEFDYKKQIQDDLDDFDIFFSDGIDDWTINKDTMGGYGFLMDKKDPKDDDFDFSNFSSAGSETEKNSVFKMLLEPNKKSHSKYDRLKVVKTEALKERYLQGAFMVDYKTARAFRTVDPGGYIIFSRDIIGNKGKLLISRISFDGKQLWQTDAKMSFGVSFAFATKTHLIVGGIINQDAKPAFVDADALRIIDLKTGSFVEVKY